MTLGAVFRLTQKSSFNQSAVVNHWLCIKHWYELWIGNQWHLDVKNWTVQLDLVGKFMEKVDGSLDRLHPKLEVFALSYEGKTTSDEIVAVCIYSWCHKRKSLLDLVIGDYWSVYSPQWYKLSVYCIIWSTCCTSVFYPFLLLYNCRYEKLPLPPSLLQYISFDSMIDERLYRPRPLTHDCPIECEYLHPWQETGEQCADIEVSDIDRETDYSSESDNNDTGWWCEVFVSDIDLSLSYPRVRGMDHSMVSGICLKEIAFPNDNDVNLIRRHVLVRAHDRYKPMIVHSYACYDI